jgi:hypothetical protein
MVNSIKTFALVIGFIALAFFIYEVSVTVDTSDGVSSVMNQVASDLPSVSFGVPAVIAVVGILYGLFA